MLVVALIAGTIGFGSGAFAWSLLSPTNRLLPSIQQRLDEQGRGLQRQQVALDGLVRGFTATSTALTDLAACRTRAPENQKDDLGARAGEGPREPDAKSQAASAASEEARQKALSVVDRAISKGTWTENDVNELRSLLGLMSGPQRDQALSALMMALNDGRLKFSGLAPF